MCAISPLEAGSTSTRFCARASASRRSRSAASDVCCVFTRPPSGRRRVYAGQPVEKYVCRSLPSLQAMRAQARRCSSRSGSCFAPSPPRLRGAARRHAALCPPPPPPPPAPRCCNPPYNSPHSAQTRVILSPARGVSRSATHPYGPRSAQRRVVLSPARGVWYRARSPLRVGARGPSFLFSFLPGGVTTRRHGRSIRTTRRRPSPRSRARSAARSTRPSCCRSSPSPRHIFVPPAHCEHDISHWAGM